MGEAVGQGAAPCRGHAMFRGGAQQVSGVPGDDQAARLGQHLLGEIGVDGEIQGVGVIAIMVPFAVGLEVGEAGFDLDADEAAVWAQRENVGAAVVVQTDLVQR